jgi:excisionase family DNA binding protein
VKQPLGFRGPEPQGTTAVFVRVPVAAARKLDRAAFELKRPKREIVGALLSALETDGQRLVLGRADLPAESAPSDDVLTVEQLAELLHVDEATVREAARKGELPGRKIGRHWRFSRRAVLDWLGARD